ncbi:MAG TPA: GvpL/GvpF family gas vesicle protein [Thermoanaerobaculia bacterium]|nr:GvpL/GvpF family gas vesicle protein [Thermoanaerobaculia bacterium]
MSPARTATYVYCLVRDSGARPSLEGVPEGLPGLSPVRLLEIPERLWLAVADAPLSQYSAEAIEPKLQDLGWVSDRALPHEAVIEFFTRGGTVLPMKLFTLFSSDEKAREHVLGQRERISRVLDKVEGCAEWGIRVRLDEARAREILSRQLQQTGTDGSGTGFLLRKKKEQEIARGLSGRLRAEMDGVFTELSRVAVDSLRREIAEGGEKLLLDAAFLVHSRHTGEFEGIVQRCAELLAEDACEVTLTGPWPAYHFLGEAG